MLHTPMTSGTYEIEADMNTAIMISRKIALNLQFLLQVSFKLSVYIINDCFEAVLLVDLIAITDRIDNGQFQSDIAFLKLVSMRFKFHRWQIMRTGCGFEAGVEKRIHESGFSKTGFTCRNKLLSQLQRRDLADIKDRHYNIPMQRILNKNPFCTDLLTNWLGRLSKPTWPDNFKVRSIDSI